MTLLGSKRQAKLTIVSNKDDFIHQPDGRNIHRKYDRTLLQEFYLMLLRVPIFTLHCPEDEEKTQVFLRLSEATILTITHDTGK